MTTFAASHILRLQWLITAADVQRKFARFVRATKANFNPDQPRVPAGNPDGGQWTSDGGGGGRDPGSGGNTQSPKPGQHHYVPQSVFKKKPLQPETRKIFDETTTARLHGGAHRWDRDHFQYNKAVSEGFDDFMRRNGIRPEQMTPDQSRSFVQEILRSRDPRIRGYNLRLYMREFQYSCVAYPVDLNSKDGP